MRSPRALRARLRPSARACAPLLLALGACSSPSIVWVDLPELPAEIRSVIVTIDSALPPTTGGDLLHRLIKSRDAFEREVIDVEYSTGPDAEVHVTGLEYSLEQLQLEPGPLPLAPSGTTGRLLPIPAVSFVRSVRGDAPSTWAREDVPAEIVELRLSPIDWSSCVSAGGCWIPNEERPEEELCTLPCPRPAAPIPPTEPAPPALPTLPVLTPCPAGWLEVAPSDDVPVATCEPPVPQDTCPTGQYQPVGATACQPVGSACAADGWPASIPAGRPVLFVRAGASTGGNGTRGAPLASISAALARVTPGDGTIIAVSAGDYLEALDLRDGVLLLGACPEATVLRATGAAIALGAGVAAVQDLRVAEGAPAIFVGGAARLSLEGVAIESEGAVAIGAGLEARAGALVSGRRVSIRGTAREGVFAADGARIELSSAVIEDVHVAGARAGGDGSHLGLTSTRVRDVAQTGTPEDIGFAVWVHARATAELEAVVLEDVASTTLAVDDGGRANVRDLVARGGRAEGLIASGGIAVTGGGTLTLSRARVTQSHGDVVYLHRSRVELDDLVVDHTLSDVTQGPGGSGLIALEGSTSTITRALVSRAGGVGLIATGVDAHVVARDVTIQDQQGSSSGSEGFGVFVDDLGSMTLSRVRVSRARARGIFVTGAGTMELGDVTVEDTLPRLSDGHAGEGLIVTESARLTGARLALRRAQVFGAFVEGEGARASLTDVVVESIATLELDGERFGGEGLRVVGGELEVERVVVRDVERSALGCDEPTPWVRITDGDFEGGGTLGFSLEGEEADVELVRVVFHDSAGPGIAAGGGTKLVAEDLVVERSGTIGVTASGQADLSFLRFRFSDSGATGLELGDHAVSLKRGVYSFSDGEITRNRIGTSVPSDPALVRTVAERVRYAENGTAIESR
ncbi:hypothetical protein L6R52_20190 [Myxococcota bacterium]|nr:hypothetical protein [Myxococcota bacterium]